MHITEHIMGITEVSKPAMILVKNSACSVAEKDEKK